MMNFIEEEAPTLEELQQLVKQKHGPTAEIISYSNARKGGFLGFFEKQVVRGQCIINNRSNSINAYRPIAGKLDQERIEAEKQKILATVASDKLLKDMRDKLVDIEKKLVEPGSRASRHASIQKMEKLLKRNEFSDSYTEMILNRIEKELSLKEIEDYELVKTKVREWVDSSIKIFNNETLSSGGKPHVMILIGPTGVGKTTTIAKLAHRLAYGEDLYSDPKKTVILNIDAYRIGASAQIEKYGEIMNVPVKTTESKEELKKQLLFNHDADYILIDTIGKSPKDYKLFAEMKELLDVCRSDAQIFLAINASTKSSDIEDIIKHFEIYKYQSVILTKLDETLRVGNIISILYENNKSLAYITTGQTVPHDIEEASRRKLMINLEGFSSSIGDEDREIKNNFEGKERI